ncbi:Group II intron, maturase [Planctomycetales bacterium 10988]|nr:Group II intron, maturase [Planctomycetales bacterium 10988]
MTSGANTSYYRNPMLPFGRRTAGEGGDLRTRGQDQQSAHRRNAPYSIELPGQFNLADFAKVKHLHTAYRILEREGGDAAGIDGLRFEDLSPGEVFGILRATSKSLLRQTYRPQETRLVQIPKGDGRYRQLRLQCLTDRTIAKALQLALKPYWQSQLPRLGQDVWHLFAQMQRVMRERRAYILAIDDIRDCFPSARIEDVLACHREHMTQPDLLWLVERLVRGHEGPDRTTGLDQGSPFSPLAMELLLHHRLDFPLGTRSQGYPLLLRYVDNLTFVCSGEREGREILQRTDSILSGIGLTLKGQDGEPQDIRDPHFNTTVLGFIPQWRNGQLKFGIPESAFEDLGQGLFHTINHPQTAKVANLVVQGWIEAKGPAFTNRAAPEVIDRILHIGREYGYRCFCKKELRRTASNARKRWIEFSQSI